MFVNETLKNHLETSSSINIRSLVLAEWNMNMPDNIKMLGNYRYRPTSTDTKYKTIPLTFDINDAGNFYTGATDSDIVVDGGYNQFDEPIQFIATKEKNKLLFSLEDCLQPFRPRSGINKAVYFPGTQAKPNKYLANSGKDMAKRPRYYMPSRFDQFRYWTSYRTENNIEYGIAKHIQNDQYFIDDTAPFVVYKNQVTANRIVIKMQTNVGTVDLGPFKTSTQSLSDPLYGNSNKTTPSKWKIQYLKNNQWFDVYSFNENSTRENSTPIIGPDGYLELHYGLIIPEAYRSSFIFAEQLSSATLLPEKSVNGYAYLVVSNSTDLGTFHIWTGTKYETFKPTYGWSIGDETIKRNINYVTDLTSPNSFYDTLNSQTKYREFEYIQGMRIVVDTMNKFDSTFDLIEMSPRLVVDLSEKTVNYQVTKTMSDIGITSLPVGQLLASTGKLTIFDEDSAFSTLNSKSIIKDYIRKNIKFNFYESIIDVDGNDYFIPIKTLYSEGFPQSDGATINLSLRDMYFFLESMPAPRLLATNASLSYAVATLLDSIGFTNYVFKRLDSEKDPIIPYFFVAPDQNIAQILNELAISTQSSMFFDEYNNFVIMSKDYLLPSSTARSTDMILSGNNNQTKDGIVENVSSGILPNIISISSRDNKIYNSGKISYTTRYIQRSYGSIRQASMVDKDKTWIYKPVLLWEASGTENTKTINEQASKQSKYTLGAMALNSNLPATPPTVVNGVLTNNVIDFGENIYWLTRYQGFLYSGGEVIKYDSAQFNITGTGNVWISDNQEYQKYFASLPFNGKIYPTGLLRIYAKPYYETINGVTKLKNGDVQEHGRAQFGTTITSHAAGIDEYWTNNDNVRSCKMKSEYLFSDPTAEYSVEVGSAGVDNVIARQSVRTGIIKNFMATNYLTEKQLNALKSTQTGTIQSSALIMNGPDFTTTQNPLQYITYVKKEMNNKYKHFGTRMRIVGKIENSTSRTQTPVGSTAYYQLVGQDPTQNVSIGGGSGGIGIMVNPDTNVGYYFEIIALTEGNIQSYLTGSNANYNINNIVFYKIMKDSESSDAVPVKLWGGLTKILVDDGKFTGQYRMAGEENPTVYDLSIEYQDIGKIRRFYLYLNNKLIQVVDDDNPLPIYNNMSLFVRGASRCMFEHVYMLSENYAQNTVFTVGETLSNVFGDKQVNANESFRKYAMSGIIQSTYLSGISSQQPPKYNMYFDEFGSIMRECAYFDIRYDRAYPALYAQLSPTFNRIKAYTTSGFQADSYGAEFLIFNATDKALVLDETSGNYLRIQGIAFTQDTTHELSVDEYFNKKSNLANPILSGTTVIQSPLVEQAKYDEIKLSRIIYGKNEFSIDAPYIQTEDDANNLMGWIINKVMKPKKSIGLNMFAIPTLQLGDIVTINYKDENGLDIVTSADTRFVVYNIDYSREENGPQMTIYLSEV